MNGKTAKLLKKWAREISEKPKKVRRDWVRLNRDERTAKRKAIKEQLNG